MDFPKRQAPGVLALLLVFVTSVTLTDWSEPSLVKDRRAVEPGYWLEGYLQSRHIPITMTGSRGTATDENKGLTTALVMPEDIVVPDLASRPFRSIATYYADAYHGRKMADGEIFDMYDPTTTASNWWALGTSLRVTHAENGRSVIVAVTDRGLFNHALDLSWAAFHQLDDPATGVIPVEVEVLD